MSADHIIRLTNATFSTLASHSDLSPNNPTINACLGSFVSALTAAEQSLDDKCAVLDHRHVSHVRPHLLRLLSRAEYEMEAHFARHFNAQENLTLADLSAFWYLDNYRALVVQELDGLAAHGLVVDGPIGFVGAGPLPLSAIGYVRRTGQSCVCLDTSEDAIVAGRTLVERLGFADKITFAAIDGAELDYSGLSLIFVASLVTGKSNVLRRIRATAPDATVAVRSADGLMTLLYDPVDVAEICSHGYHHAGTAFATEKTVNSTCFFMPCGNAGIC